MSALPPPVTRPAGLPRAVRRAAALALAAGLAGCATGPQEPVDPGLAPEPGRALIQRGMPTGVADRGAWATDVYAAFASLDIPPTPDRLCAALAVIEQESSFRAQPTVPGLAKIAWREIDERAERLGVPALLVRTALRLPSPTGKSYAERIDDARTEQDLSQVFDDLIDRVPLGQRLFGRWNPVRTGGPMQVAIAYAETHVKERPYPYPHSGSVRDEVFTRRGGVYFGIAHLFDYPADYDRLIYRYADFNAGHYASRNAAFQAAVTAATGIPLALDGDLIVHGSEQAGSTELATRVLARRLGFDDADVRQALERGLSADFSKTDLYEKVFEAADRRAGRRLARATVPNIRLQSPKITRQLTTEWFANRVDERQRRCIARAAGG